MPRANLSFQGFRVAYPDQAPEPIPAFVADNYATALYVGDPVTYQTDGSVARTAAGSGAGISGVIVAITGLMLNGVFVRNAKYVPANTRWTADADRTQLLIAPVYPDARFLVQADDGTTITTVAAARSAVGNNADHVFQTADTGLGLSGACLDISTVNTTATLQWRIRDVIVGPHSDPTLTRCTYVVTANVITNFGGLPAVLGV